MNFKYLIKFLIFNILLISSIEKISAQTCGTCAITINSSDTSAIVLNSGQTLCIDTMGYFSGTIVLNGGSICNKGFFKPTSITVNSGTVVNYANASIDGSIIVNSGIIINNESGSIFTINGTLTISGGTYNNNGISNIDSSISNNSGSFSNTSIINCSQLIGSNTVNNTGIINAN